MKSSAFNFILFFAALAFHTQSAFAQGEPAWWTQKKLECHLSSSLAYNTWIAQGMPCNKDVGTGSTSGTAIPPALQNAASQLGYALGAELGKALFGDPAEEARRAELLRQQQAQLAEDERVARIEDDRRREEVFQRLASAFKGFDGDRGELTLKGVDLDQSQNGNPLGLKLGDPTEKDDGLRPQGSSFFGEGGGSGSQAPTEPNTDPMVVDLRDLNKSAYLIQSAETASEDDAPLLLIEAFKAANGDKSFTGSIPAGITMPVVDESGLLAFQKANNDYRKANDFQMKCTEAFNLAQQHRELADRMAKAARADLEQAKAKLMDEATLKKKSQLMGDIFAAIKAEDEAWAKAGAEVEAARTRNYQAREEAMRVLRAAATGKDLATFHPPIASLPGLDEKTWMQVQERMIVSRNDLDRENSDIRTKLEDLKVPVPSTYEHMHEGVILGANTDSGDARDMYDTISPFSGKTPLEMNEAAENAKKNGIKGVGGAMVVSFGTPKDGSLAQKAVEATRVLGDHVTVGQVSLNTPQGKEAVAVLSGKEFDRLIAHSNGASITEALIQEDLIKVNELDIVGGDRSLLNGHAFQKLLDAGKVKRVVVWINVNDPVVWATAPDQLKLANRGNDALEHIGRKITGELAGGDLRVEYHFMVGKGKNFTFEPHYLEAYYSNIAKEFRTP